VDETYLTEPNPTTVETSCDVEMYPILPKPFIVLENWVFKLIDEINELTAIPITVDVSCDEDIYVLIKFVNPATDETSCEDET